jgi:hypothetical protein
MLFSSSLVALELASATSCTTRIPPHMRPLSPARQRTSISSAHKVCEHVYIVRQRYICSDRYVSMYTLVATAFATSAYTLSANSYLLGANFALFTDASSTACAELCSQTSYCKSFMSGTSGRLGICFLNNATKSSAGTTFKTSYDRLLAGFHALT